MKLFKKEHAGALEIGQVYYTKRFTLTVDRELCKGCDLCRLACPRDAIKLVPQDKEADGRARAPTVDIDKTKCDFHGICAVVCPFNAIKITVNDNKELPAVARDAFPELIRDLEIDSAKCEAGCRKCEKKCPQKIIAVKQTADGKNEVSFDKQLCSGCQVCWVECPTDAVKVTKFYEGNIDIHTDKCPEGCKNCADVCPVNALSPDGNGKVFASNITCIYCGACLNVCPVEGALEVERTAVRHTPINSGAWHKGLERLTSTAGLEKELAAERAGKAREVISKLELKG